MQLFANHHHTMNEMRERFDKEYKFTVYDGSPDKHNPTAKAIKSFIEAEITRAAEAMRQRCEEVVETTCEESEWECPDHGKEFRVTPPLCKGCNRCLEVNVVIAYLAKSLRTALRALTPISTKEDPHHEE